MAVYIPIISEFDSKGIDKAVKEFKSLETNGQKASFAIKKAAVPAALALAGVGAALFDATKGAMEDDAAQKLLAATLQKTTGATDAQIKANEDWISTQGKLLGITDDELRPVMSRLAKATGSVTEAQKLATQAMDIAASTGKPLATVTASLEKAYGGNLTALAKLAPEYRQLIKDGASFEDVMAKISETTGGAATTAANSAQGQFKRLSVSLSETKESIGAALLPIVEKAIPVLAALGNWASEHTSTFLAIAAAIGAIAAAVVIANTAMKVYEAYTKIATAAQWLFNAAVSANPIVLVGIAIAALIAGLVIAYNKFDAVRDIIDAIGRAIKTGFMVYIGVIKTEAEMLYGVFKTLFNGIASIWNNTVGKLSFKLPGWLPGDLGGAGFSMPKIPMLADGGIVTSPTLAMIGERGPEAVIPLTGPNAGGGYGGGNNITINVNGGDPNSIVRALQQYVRQSGPVPLNTRAM